MAEKNESLLDRILVGLGKILVTPFQILLSLLGIIVVAGKVIFTFIGAIVALFVLTIALFLNQVFDVDITADIKPNTVVELNLAGTASEAPGGNPILKFLGKAGQTLPDILDTLRSIEQDDDITGLVLRLDHCALAPAQVEEIRDQILKLRKKGKKVLAYADNFEGAGNSGTFAYYLACSADEIWMRNMGQVGIQGVLLEVPFAKKALDKIGVKSLIRKRYEYKNAPDSLSEEKFTSPSRESLQALLDSFMKDIEQGIQTGRDLTPDQVKESIHKAPWTDGEAKRLGLIDHIAHDDEILSFFTDETQETDPEILNASNYMNRRSFSGSTAKLREHVESAKTVLNQDTGKDSVTFAIVYGEGDIVHDKKGDTSFKNQLKMGGHSIAKSINAATKNEAVKAIIFRMNTGGGSPTGSEIIRRAVDQARQKGKKVIISMGGACASGGYWISTAAHKIVAQPTSITGSIGVYNGKLHTAQLWENLGIFWDEVHGGENALYASQTQDYTPHGLKQLNAQLDRIYEEFIQRVADARKLEVDHVKEIAKGRVWSGRDAHTFGLVDALGGIETAVDIALKDLGLPADTPVELVSYPKPVSFAQKLESLWSLDMGTAMGALFSALGETISTLSLSSEKTHMKMADFSYG